MTATLCQSLVVKSLFLIQRFMIFRIESNYPVKIRHLCDEVWPCNSLFCGSIFKETMEEGVYLFVVGVRKLTVQWNGWS